MKGSEGEIQNKTKTKTKPSLYPKVSNRGRALEVFRESSKALGKGRSKDV